MKEVFDKIRKILINDKKIRYVVLDFEDTPELFEDIKEYHISTRLGNSTAWITADKEDINFLLFSVSNINNMMNMNYNSVCDTASEYMDRNQNGSIKQNVLVKYKDIYTPPVKKPKLKLDL